MLENAEIKLGDGETKGELRESMLGHDESKLKYAEIKLKNDETKLGFDETKLEIVVPKSGNEPAKRCNSENMSHLRKKRQVLPILVPGWPAT
jgi:hypothetical protein